MSQWTRCRGDLIIWKLRYRHNRREVGIDRGDWRDIRANLLQGSVKQEGLSDILKWHDNVKPAHIDLLSIR